ncbi:hypothetical protein RhiirC2_776200 [Rhizophagus irregularis]|uniref:Uncharacterized protein n=1 Tax=Rhizophagus irregularis TaxID=588596 RepID=A0A2N1NH93_9GLOM|nr:hypothetical protein RhiirC2_776200 [Rhizophagus irregularis]
MIAHKEENDIEIKVYNGEYDSDIEAELEQVNVEHNFDNNQEERDEIIPNDENEGLTSQKYNALSPCVIIDNIHDQDAVQQVNNDHLKLGVYDSHFLYDQNQIHDPKEKIFKEFTDGILPAFNEMNKSRFICCACYERLGRYIHKRTGRGKKSNCVQDKLHEEDITKGIKIIANWFIKFSHTDEETKKKDILRSIVKVIFPFISTSTKITSSTLNNFKSDETPSLFTIQILFLDTSISNSKECDDILDCEKFR